jgi:hypothetical protein
MLSERESQFREAEQQLDALVFRDRAGLETFGIEIADESTRTYAREPMLVWEYRFESRRPRGSDVEKVTVRLRMDEFDCPRVEVEARAEIFSIGARSRWAQDWERSLSLEALVQQGLGNIVRQCIDDGHAEAARYALHR